MVLFLMNSGPGFDLKAMAKAKLLYSDFSGFRVDFENKQVLRDGHPVVLTQKCFELLQYLLIQRDRVLRKKELLDSIWEGTFVDEATLTQHIYMLRKVFRNNGAKEFPIETIPKNGYKFVGEVVDVFEENIDNSFPPDNFAKGLFLEEKLTPHVESDSPLHTSSRWPKLSSLPISNHRRVVISSFVLLLFAAINAVVYVESRPAEANTSVTSLAVLPFHRLGLRDDSDIGLGVADSLIARLGKLENVRVIPTSAVIRFDTNDNLDPFEAAESLKADAVVWGTIQKDQDKMRVTFHVYCMRNKVTLMSETIDGKYTDMFSMEDHISEKVLGLLAAAAKS